MGEKLKLKVCRGCNNIKPYCGTCVYRFCNNEEDCSFVTTLCEDLRNKIITDRQFTIRFKKRFGRKDYE